MRWAEGLAWAAVLLAASVVVLSREHEPALSIVLCGRLAEDASRLREFLAHMQHLLGTHGPVALEVVFVSWDVALLAHEQALARQLQRDFAVLVHVVVSATQAAEYARALGPDAASVGFFEFAGKNRGLDVARGRHVLVTNVDILWSPCVADAVVRVLRSARSAPHVWRAYRSDLHAPLAPQSDMRLLSEQLDRAPQRVHTRTNATTIEGEGPLASWHLLDNAAGDFLLAPRSAWARTSGFAPLPFTWHMDSLQLHRFQVAGVSQRVLPCRVHHRWHPLRSRTPRPAIPLALLDRWALEEPGALR